MNTLIWDIGKVGQCKKTGIMVGAIPDLANPLAIAIFNINNQMVAGGWQLEQGFFATEMDLAGHDSGLENLVGDGKLRRKVRQACTAAGYFVEFNDDYTAMLLAVDMKDEKTVRKIKEAARS